MDAKEHGRARLEAWQASRPSSFLDQDPHLMRALRLRLGASRLEAVLPDLERAGRDAATTVRRAGELTNLDENLPRLSRFDGLGRRVEEIVFHPSYHDAGRAVWRSGVMARFAEPGLETESLALFYLFAHNGEYGHGCPLACTAGLSLLLRAQGSDAQRRAWLPGLVERDYGARLWGAQFLTEIQGGSDVGANAVRAVPEADGRYRIYGEKWFCSVADAPLFLLTARPEGATAGTRGLSAFVVPRRIGDQSNHFAIRRLKHKLGTRAMASAEIDFEGALAEPLGPIDRGFRNVVEVVLDTSRIFNALACAGSMQRAWLEASSFARAREAFGRPIAEFPLVVEACFSIRARAMAALSGGLRITALRDQLALGSAPPATEAVLRMAINAHKYWTSVENTQCVRTAMEVLGGNGAIESFSILPQLYRDAMVLESWEGTHNVLSEQIARDASRLGLHEPFLEALRAAVTGLRPGPGAHSEVVPALEAALEGLSAALSGVARGGEDQRFSRRVAERMAIVFSLVAMAEELATSPEDAELAEAIRALLPERPELAPPRPLPAHDVFGARSL